MSQFAPERVPHLVLVLEPVPPAVADLIVRGRLDYGNYRARRFGPELGLFAFFHAARISPSCSRIKRKAVLNEARLNPQF